MGELKITLFRVFSLVVTFLFFTLFLFSVIGVFTFLFHFENVQPSPTNTYQKSKFDPSTNKSTKSYTKLSRSLKPGEHVSYWNKRGEYIVISEISQLTFKCGASCVCKSERRNVVAAGRVFYFIFSAFSAVAATKVAEEYFSSVCRRQKFTDDFINKDLPEEKDLENDCGDIFLDYCDEEDQNKHLLDFVEPEETEKYFFDCYGKCRKKENIETPELEAKADKIDCSTFDFDGFIHVPWDQLDKDTVVRKIFREEYLDPFCQGLSQYPWFPYAHLPEFEEYVSVCVGEFIENIDCEFERSI